jgi:hypothetical protein
VGLQKFLYVQRILSEVCHIFDEQVDDFGGLLHI